MREEKKPWARHRSPPLQKESTAGGIDQLPCVSASAPP